VNAQWVNWLDQDDMLPAVAPQARIMRYGYQSKWFGEEAMRQKASTVAQRLLLALKREREVGSDSVHPTYYHSNFCCQRDQYRPLIFLAHCFGGLVVLKVSV
jgi:hypothetical protein